jgi:transcriptional regulator with XRE-family HTH domain
MSKFESSLVEKEYNAVLQKIIALRKLHGVSQNKMSEKVGLTSSGYQKVEKGNTKLDIERLLVILKVFEISASDFFKDFKDTKISF